MGIRIRVRGFVGMVGVRIRLRSCLMQYASEVESQSWRSIIQPGFLIDQVKKLVPRCRFERRFCLGGHKTRPDCGYPGPRFRFSCVSSIKVPTKLEMQGRVCACAAAAIHMASCSLFIVSSSSWRCRDVNVQLPPSSSPLSKMYFCFNLESRRI